MIESFTAPLPLIGLTIGAFFLGLAVFKLTRQFPLCHPLVISSALIALVVFQLDADYPAYQSANQVFYLVLGPATVALAIPVQREFHHILEAKGPILITLATGAVIAPLSAIVIAFLSGGNSAVMHALLTKSVTTPIALGVASISTSADPGLVAAVVIFSGVVTAVAATPVYRLLRISDKRIQGLCLGINGHAAGTTRGFEISPVCGAFSSLALGMTGCITAVALPLLIRLFG